MRMIKFVVNAMENNISEARRYVEEFYRLRESNVDIAAWCATMATNHLNFNSTGHELVKRMIAEAQKSNTKSEMMDGMMAIWQDKHADMMRETAEIKSMLELYK